MRVLGRAAAALLATGDRLCGPGVGRDGAARGHAFGPQEGPFIFKKDEWKAGEKAVYVRNPNYKPQGEPASGLAGGKLAKVDRVE